MKKEVQLPTKDEIIEKIRKEKKFLSEKYFITEIGLFGSYVRGEQKKRSDIDILVEFKKYPNIFTFIEIEEHLSKLFGIKVDLVTKNAPKPVIGYYIKKEVIFV